MSTLLRPSTRQAARLASFSLRNSAHSRSALRISRPWQWQATSLLCLRQPNSRYGVQRFYSTEPPSNPNDADKKPSDPSDPKKRDPRPPLPEGFVYLTDAELEIFKKLNPGGAGGDFFKLDDKIEELTGYMRHYGAPVEMRDLLIKHKTQGLGMADALRCVKIAHKLAERVADWEVNHSDNKTDFTSNDGKRQNMGDGRLREAQRKAKQELEEMKGKQSGQQDQQGQQEQQGRQDHQQQKGQDGKKGSSGGPSFLGRDVKSGDILNWMLIAAFAYPLYNMFYEGASRDITWQELRRTFLDKGLVEKLVVINDRVRVELNKEATRNVYPDSVAVNPGFHYYINIGSVEVFENQLSEAQNELGIPSSERIPVSYLKPATSTKLLMAYGPTLLVVGIIFWSLRRMSAGGGMGSGSGGVFGVGKSKAKRFNHDTAVKVKFADVAGMDEAKVEIMEFVSFLKTPDRFEKLGAKIPRGAILAGPPGTGKTLLAKATAGESGVPFFSVSGSEFVEMFVGVGASRVRDLFQTARKSAPCIIFIDEIDAIGRARNEGSRFGGDSEREATLNQILTEMDGFNTTDQVVVLCGTNRPDILDKALTRPGRFDRHIHIDAPTMDGRIDIFKVHLQRIVTNEEINFLAGRLAALTPGFSGADIANAVNEAALVAARANASSVAMIHFEQAIERVIGGLERKSLVLDKKERRVVAYHEAGHAICGWYFKYADPLLKVSIIPRAKGTLGYAQYLPGDAYLMNRFQLMDRMAMALGGRISEELNFETVTTGAADDFRKVTAMATQMVTQWGMSDKVGPLHFKQDSNQFQKPFAESTAQTIDSEVRLIIDGAYKQCKDLLMEKSADVKKVAEELLKKEVLDRDDMIRLLGKRPFEDREDFNKFFDGKRGKGVKPGPVPPENTNEPPPPGAVAPSPALFKGLDAESR